jgi:alginate O-acetyltransferase complex protein AlgI
VGTEVDTASIQFIIFGLGVAILSNFSRSPVWRSSVLAFASIVFLSLLAMPPVVLIPLIGFLLLGYAGIAVQRPERPKLMATSISIVVFAYIWLKKYTFLPGGIFLTHPYFTLGLSYIFFRVLHLLIEAPESNGERRISFGSFLLYALNFTTLVSGPIQRYDQFAQDQFASQPLPLGAGVVALQLERIVCGFFKVNVLATLLDMLRVDALAEMWQPVPASFKMFAAFRLAIVYPLFLYSNFSGYIDIVIGLARLMRLRLPENFNRPFSASSFIEFWDRWHITLSTWLKSYVYNPLLLALMRHVESRSAEQFVGVFSFFVTFFLIGVWHGRTSAFVFFGVLQGAGVAINKLWQLKLTGAFGRTRYRALAANPLYIAFSRGLTFSWFALTLFWFWAGWSQIQKIYSSLNAIEWLGVWISVWLCSTAALALWEGLRGALLAVKTSTGPVFTSPYARVVYTSALGVIALVLRVLLSLPAPDIIYKAF